MIYFAVLWLLLAEVAWAGPGQYQPFGALTQCF